MKWSKAIPAVGLIVSVTIPAFIVGGWFYSYGKLEARVDALAKDQAEMRQEMRNGFDRLDADIENLRQEIRMSKAEIMAAISEHGHDDEGKVVFRRPY